MLKRTGYLTPSEARVSLASITHYNNAPRGGASGEHVELIGKVAKDVKKGFKAFATRCELSGDKKYKYSWNIEGDYLETLKK